jgi:hypothetical protein
MPVPISGGGYMSFAFYLFADSVKGQGDAY